MRPGGRKVQVADTHPTSYLATTKNLTRIIPRLSGTALGGTTKTCASGGCQMVIKEQGEGMALTRHGVLVCACMLVVGGCGQTDSETETASASFAGGEWQVDSVPAVVVGTEASGVLFDVVSWGVRFADGRIAVADGRTSSRISLFSPEGVFEREIGRTGQGPGEFIWIFHMSLGPEDSLYVFDRNQQRLTVFSPDRELARVVPFRPPPDGSSRGGLMRVFRLENDTWVGQGAESMLPANPGTFAQDTVVVGLMDGNLDEYTAVTLLPGHLTTSTVEAGQLRPMVPAFTPQSLAAAWGGCVFVSYTEDPTISVYASDGTLVTAFDGPGTRRPVTRRHLDERIEAHLEPRPRADRSRYERLFNSTAHTTHLPFYGALLLDQWGHLWLQEYSPPYGSGSRWHVLSQAGEWLADVDMPHDLRVFSISEAGVLGQRTVDHGVQLVELLPLSRIPSERAPVLEACAPPSESGSR
jgi:hypothetical protein